MIRRRQSGFTLIELMITVAIVAILATIAYPAYRDQVLRTRRADAEGALMSFASAMERFYTQNNTYLGAATGGANTGAPAASVFVSEAPVDGNTKYYDLRITAATASTYTLQAQPKGDQANDTKCATLTLDQANARGATGTAPTTCW